MGDGERLSSELLSHEALVQKGWELQKKGLHTPQMDGAGCPCSPYTLGDVCVFQLLATIVGVGVPLLPSSSALVSACSSPPHSGPPFPLCSQGSGTGHLGLGNGPE